MAVAREAAGSPRESSVAGVRTLRPRARLRVAGVSDPLLRSAYSLILNVALTSVLGVGFWIVAARLLQSASVGRDGALVSAMMVVSTVCQLNFSSVILRFLPSASCGPTGSVLGTYAATAVASLMGGVGFRARRSPRFAVLRVPVA